MAMENITQSFTDILSNDFVVGFIVFILIAYMVYKFAKENFVWKYRT